jgi:ubiquinone biosynthesis protein Coq4
MYKNSIMNVAQFYRYLGVTYCLHLEGRKVKPSKCKGNLKYVKTKTVFRNYVETHDIQHTVCPKDHREDKNINGIIFGNIKLILKSFYKITYA